jgi:hypothetical protein
MHVSLVALVFVQTGAVEKDCDQVAVGGVPAAVMSSQLWEPSIIKPSELVQAVGRVKVN